MDDWLGMLVAGVIVELIPVDSTFEFDRTRNLARFDDRVVDCTLINDARLEVEPTLFSRNLSLVFGIRGTIRLVLPLRRAERDLVPDDARERVIQMLEQSNIAVPFDKRFDPSGKFARSGSPTNVTREEAIALVRNPPLPGEPLPIIL